MGKLLKDTYLHTYLVGRMYVKMNIRFFPADKRKRGKGRKVCGEGRIRRLEMSKLVFVSYRIALNCNSCYYSYHRRN